MVEGQKIVFGGKKIKDGNIMKMEWEVNGKKFEGEKIKHVFEEKGKQTITIVATDDKGETRSMEIIINAINYELYFQLCLIFGYPFLHD